MDRWRGRLGGLAILALVATASVLAAVGFATVRPGSPSTPAPRSDWQLVVRATNKDVLLRLPLPDGRFTLRYRNSLYGSLAEERFEIDPEGAIVLVELAADEAAVLDEYYTTDRPRPGDPGDTRRWRARPAAPLTLEELVVAASQHSRRTLVVEGHSVRLWPLAPAGTPTVILEAEEVG
jgi:hypothetical protein